MTEEKAVTTMTEEGVPVLTLEPLEQTALAEPAGAPAWLVLVMGGSPLCRPNAG